MTTGQVKTTSDTVIKQHTLSQESVAPPLPKPRSSGPISSPLISVLQESDVKSETESDTDTITFSDSTIRVHPPSASVRKQSMFTGSSDTSNHEGSETEATDIAVSQISGVPTTVSSAVTVFTQQHSHTEDEEAIGSSDSEAEYLAKCMDKPLAYENTAFVEDDGSSKPSSRSGSLDDSKEIPVIPGKRALFEKSLEQTLPLAASSKVYGRSASLPTDDLIAFDHNGGVRAKKQYFEAQIKKEMVVEQLMTQLEEEASPEHKAISQAAVDQDNISVESGSYVGSLMEDVKLKHISDIRSTSITDAPEKYVQKPSYVTEDDKTELEVDKVSGTKAVSVKDIAKDFEKESFAPCQGVVVPSTSLHEASDYTLKGAAGDFEQQIVKPELLRDVIEEGKAMKDTESAFESKVQASVPEVADGLTGSATEDDATIIENVMEMRYDVSDIDFPSETLEEETANQLADVIHFKTENITKPSDSLEVHVDKSEIEETEKMCDIEEDIKGVDPNRTEGEVIPSITVTLSGKQKRDSCSQGESEDTASESDVTPEEHPLYQPEEHVHDTVWEVPVQEQPESLLKETVEDIPIEKQVIVEKDEDEGSEMSLKMSEEEARIIAEQVVESIEAEVAKRSDLIADTVSPPVPPPETAESQVTEYLRQLASKEELEPQEVQLMESVLARKHREEMKKLSRTDTGTSSMEITDEDLRSSGVETDLSPLDSHVGRVQERAMSDDTQHDDVSVKLQGEEVVEKTLAEVRESLEAAQEQLIEQHMKKEEVVQKKESPSEFEFKVLTFEKTLGESIKESHYEEVSATAENVESMNDGVTISQTTDIGMKEKDDWVTELKNVERTEISVGKDGTQKITDTKQQILDERDVKCKESRFEDAAMMRKDEGLTGEHRVSASFLDQEELSSLCKITETQTETEHGVQATKVTENKGVSQAVSEEKLVIETKLEEGHDGSAYEKEDITRTHTESSKLEEKETKIQEGTEEDLKTAFRGQTDSCSVEERKVERLSTSTVVDKKERSTERETSVSETSKSNQKTEEATKTERKVEIKKIFKMDSDVLETTTIDQVMPTLTEGIELSHESIRLTEKEMIRTSSEESQRSLSQDESTKSPVDSSSSSGRRAETETVRVVERPDGTEAIVVVLRHPQQSKPDAESSSSGERSGSATLRADRRSGADFEAWSSSGESHYHSFEQTSESGRTSSRPCSSDIEALMAGVGTAGSSEYESALTSQEFSARSASHDYHTAVSSLSSRDSMKSLDSESSGHLASIEISSEASETLVPSALELEKDMEGASGMLVMDDEDIEHRELESSQPLGMEAVVETYDEVPHISDGRQSPFEIISESDVLDYHSEDIGGSEDEEVDIAESKGTPPTLSTDESGEDERPHCMKRSHEMIFQPEPMPIITDSPLSESGTEEKFGSSVEEGSILSVSLSSASDAAGLRTVIELSRADSERMDVSVTSEQLTVSGTSEQLSLEEIDQTTLTETQFVESGTCTFPTSSSGRDLHLSSVTITTSSVDECGVQSVCTQVTSQSHTPVQKDEDDDGSQERTTERHSDDFPQSNGPTQVDYVPEYDDDYDESRKRHLGHRRKESTSSFIPSVLPIMTSAAPAQIARPLPDLSPLKFDIIEGVEDMAESDKYSETGTLTLKEVCSDEKKDVDEAERLEEESYQTEADQGFHRDLREGRVLLEDVAGIEEDAEGELDTSRPQSQVSKSDSEGHRPVSSGFSDDRPDSELAELLKQCSDGGKDLEDPIERPLSPEPVDECEIKDDTPEFSSEAQASVTELEMEYSGAFSRSVEYASHVSPIREERIGMQYDEACSVIEQHSDREDDMAEAEAAFQMTAHVFSVVPPSLPATIPEDLAAEKHELETRDRTLKESRRHQDIIMTSPASIPDITVTQHMTPLVDRGFHYPDFELEDELMVAKSAPQTPASASSRASSETETDQGREYVLEDEEHDDYIREEPELEHSQEDKHIECQSMDEVSVTEDKTVYESEVKEGIKAEPASPTSESPETDSFEMLEKPDLTDEYVVIEEVGKEAEEHDTEGKSVQIQKKSQVVKKKHDPGDELISSPPAPATRMTELKYYPEPGEDMGPFPFDSDSPPNATVTKKSVGVRAHDLGYDGEEGEYDKDVEAGRKWIEMQFQGDTAAATAVAGYGYEMDFERGPLEDIKEEEVNDFDQSSSKVGSMGSYKGSIGSFGSVKESLSSTPEYDVLAGRKFFTRSGEHDDVSMSSLQEFEQLEHQIALEASRKRSHGSQDSLNGNNKRCGRSGQGDDVSLSSLKEFEGLETACIEAAKIETRAKEEEALLSEIEEGHESQVSESESCETMSVSDGRGVLGGGGESVDSDDYEKRMFEIDEIIRQAQSNVERFVDPKDDVTESVGRGDSLEEVARVPELDLDQPLYLFTGKVTTGWREAGSDVMCTSSDSLEMKDKSSALHASTDSLDLKTIADVMTTSADSVELQMQLSGRGDIMTDSMELPGDSAMMATSTDSLDLGGGAAAGATVMTDSIEEEEEEMSVLGQAEGQGSGSGGHDQSSSSGREGDFSSSGKDDNSAEHGRVPPPRSDMMLGSTDSLEPSSSTATHATYQYETDSVMSSSFTSGGSNTMVSSTDTLDPTGTGAGGLDAIDLAAAARSAGVWFDDVNGSGGKPFVTEVIEPSEEDEFSHTIRRTVELPPEIRKVSFHGPDAERALREYVERFAPGDDVSETQEVDSEGNVHIKRVVQRRVVVRSEDMTDTELTGPELEEYLRHVSSGEYEQASGEDVPESDYTHLMTSITGGAESFTSPPEVVTHHTYVTRHMIHPTPGAVVTTTTQQGLTTTTTPNLTGDLVLGDWEQHQSVSREESGMQRATRGVQPQPPCRHPPLHDISIDEDDTEVDFHEHDWRFVSEPTPELPEEGEGIAPGDAAENVFETTQTQTRVVDGKTVTTTTTTKTTKEQGSMQEHHDKDSFDKDDLGKLK
ncbi:hypothetical protein L798_07346 [Zootermopsis nevadensis]|uniref:Uncharacterized protein n=1 Tax=Zootermopsis nevadensis TaxID=136037 RepID=A0A067R8N8_ZOONE|nr:hypothetical protein L798_07346 [Zootermopsis nevadensis]